MKATFEGHYLLLIFIIYQPCQLLKISANKLFIQMAALAKHFEPELVFLNQQKYFMLVNITNPYIFVFEICP